MTNFFEMTFRTSGSTNQELVDISTLVAMIRTFVNDNDIECVLDVKETYRD